MKARPYASSAKLRTMVASYSNICSTSAMARGGTVRSALGVAVGSESICSHSGRPRWEGVPIGQAGSALSRLKPLMAEQIMADGAECVQVRGGRYHRERTPCSTAGRYGVVGTTAPCRSTLSKWWAADEPGCQAPAGLTGPVRPGAWAISSSVPRYQAFRRLAGTTFLAVSEGCRQDPKKSEKWVNLFGRWASSLSIVPRSLTPGGTRVAVDLPLLLLTFRCSSLDAYRPITAFLCEG
jgi:hypothetical protein